MAAFTHENERRLPPRALAFEENGPQEAGYRRGTCTDEG